MFALTLNAHGLNLNTAWQRLLPLCVSFGNSRLDITIHSLNSNMETDCIQFNPSIWKST